MTNFPQQVAIVEALALEVNVQHRGDCPFCNRPNTFMAENTGRRLRWYCFSANCEVKGDIKAGLTPESVADWRGSSGKAFEAPFVVPESWRLLFRGSEGPWSDVCSDYLRVNNSWDAWYGGKIEVFYDVALNRIVFGHSVGGLLVGGIGRKLGEVSKSPGPKWYKYGNSECGYTVRGPKPTDTVVVVEDVASACAVSKFTDSFSLTGTHLSATMLNEITSNWKHVIIALDKDATMKAAKMVRQLAWYSEKVGMLILEEDLKALPGVELELMLKRRGVPCD